MTHEDLIVMLHEFGHLMHSLLNRCEYYNIGGMNSMQWDAVEFPSQFFENFAWQPHVLRKICRNAKGRPPTTEMIRVTVCSRKLGSGWFMQHYVKKALIDLALHHNYKNEKNFIEKTTSKILKQNGVQCEPWVDRMLCKFHHTFGSEGSYDCAYYVYIWSELLARDVFQLFVKCRTDVKVKELLTEFTEIFFTPSQEDIRELFRKYTGRNFNTKAWLSFHGL
jgi:oligopeptidase A